MSNLKLDGFPNVNLVVSTSLPCCVICKNTRNVNKRLVIETCGHVKCVDCLLTEKSGCQACVMNIKKEVSEVVIVTDPAKNSGTIQSTKKEASTNTASTDSSTTKAEATVRPATKKKKPDTTHIKIIQENNTKNFHCTICNKKFQARTQVLYHAYCNGQRKPYECQQCNKSFATHSHYKYHMSVHRNERTFACDHCGAGFIQKSKLQRHLTKHTKEKRYVCVECGKAFTEASTLRKHALLHSGARPYVCACGERFRDASNFRRHRAKHQPNNIIKKILEAEGRAHACAGCPAAFHSDKDLRRHAAVHSEAKPFSCKECKRRFRRKDNCERHIRNTHPESLPAYLVELQDGQVLSKELTNREETEKNMLQILNPLPPLPQEEIEKLTTEPEVEAPPSVILEANTARESVIFGPVKCSASDGPPEEEASGPDNEYVHKIRKANLLASQKKDVPLPPIDENKIMELEKKSSLNHLDIGLPSHNMEVYKRILCERAVDDKGRPPPEMHWRRKMKLNIT